MALLDAAVVGGHLLFAGLWAGSVLFTTWRVLPLLDSDTLRAESADALVGGLVSLSRVSAIALLVTGGHMAGTAYTAGSLFGSPRGHLVLTMVALWAALAGLVEVGAGRLRAELDRGRVRTAADASRRFLGGASLVAVALLLVGGALSAGI